MSVRGAKLCVARHLKPRPQMPLYEVAPHIVLPNALPFFQESAAAEAARLATMTKRERRRHKHPKSARVPGFLALLAAISDTLIDCL